MAVGNNDLNRVIALRPQPIAGLQRAAGDRGLLAGLTNGITGGASVISPPGDSTRDADQANRAGSKPCSNP